MKSSWNRAQLKDHPGLYPVDILDDDPEGHREAALAYYATLRGGAPPPAAALSLPAGEQVNLEAASVCLCTLHRDEPRHKILVLVSPQDTKTGSDIWGKDCAFPSQRRYLWKVGEKIGRRRHVLFASLCEGAGENSVARRSGGRVLHNEKERQPVRGWHGSLLPAARPRHCVCPEGTPAPGPGHGHAAGLLWNIPGRGGPGGQLADFSCHVPSLQEVPAGPPGAARAPVGGGAPWSLGPAGQHLAEASTATGQTPRPRVGVRGTWMSLLPGVWMRPGWCPACCCCWSTGRDAGWWPMSSLTFPSERTAPAEPLPAKRSPI
ncbi:uncharacterized protein WM277_009234 isoform 2-T2 [Molossus nigricans]